MSLNTCAIVGVLSREPSTKFEPSGSQTTALTVRCDEVGRDGQTHALYVSVQCYGKTADQAATLGLDDVVAVEGKLMFKAYADRDGQKRSTLCVLARQIQVLASAAATAEGELDGTALRFRYGRV